jgi:hypothetical protein
MTSQRNNAKGCPRFGLNRRSSLPGSDDLRGLERSWSTSGESQTVIRTGLAGPNRFPAAIDHRRSTC